MKKIRYYLATIVLAAILSGPALPTMGSASMANAASSRHVSAASVVAFTIKPPCGTVVDC
jgi:hypothetical protein